MVAQMAAPQGNDQSQKHPSTNHNTTHDNGSNNSNSNSEKKEHKLDHNHDDDEHDHHSNAASLSAHHCLPTPSWVKGLGALMAKSPSPSPSSTSVAVEAPAITSSSSSTPSPPSSSLSGGGLDNDALIPPAQSSSLPSSIELSSLSILELLRLFRSQQEDRALAYSYFDKAFMVSNTSLYIHTYACE
jgi:hypothetical protein